MTRSPVREYGHRTVKCMCTHSLSATHRFVVSERLQLLQETGTDYPGFLCIHISHHICSVDGVLALLINLSPSLDRLFVDMARREHQLIPKTVRPRPQA